MRVRHRIEHNGHASRRAKSAKSLQCDGLTLSVTVLLASSRDGDGKMAVLSLEEHPSPSPSATCRPRPPRTTRGEQRCRRRPRKAGSMVGPGRARPSDGVDRVPASADAAWYLPSTLTAWQLAACCRAICGPDTVDERPSGEPWAPYAPSKACTQAIPTARAARVRAYDRKGRATALRATGTAASSLDLLGRCRRG